jgi:hypothetical protein
MSVLFRFNPGNLTAGRYDDVMRRLNEGGHWPPAGLEYHVCFGSEGQMKVSEIWSSTDEQAAFAEHLMPVLQDAGIELSGPPEQIEVYNQERF